MPRFEYMARDESGQAISGEIVAGSRNEAARLLRMEGKFVVKVVEQDSDQQDVNAAVRIGSSRIKEDQVIYFANQLAVMVDTGVPLADALTATIQDEPVGGFRNVIDDVINHVHAGQEFSASLERHPRVFPKFFSNIIRASEASGLLGTMLQRIAAYMTQQREIRKRISRALTYPFAMVLFCVIVAVLLITFLLPKFTRIFEQRGADLPRPTQLLLDTTTFLHGNWILLSIGFVLSAIGMWLFLKTPRGFMVTSWIKINAPVVGAMYRKSYITRCMRTMGTMIDAGVSMLDTVAITKNIIENYYFQELFDAVDEKLQKGHMLSDSLKGSDLFPHAITQMVLAGERAGQLGPVMDRIADFCEHDLDHAVKSTTQLIEPLLVIVMGSFIGGIAIALLLPIFRLSQVVSAG